MFLGCCSGAGLELGGVDLLYERDVRMGWRQLLNGVESFGVEEEVRMECSWFLHGAEPETRLFWAFL